MCFGQYRGDMLSPRRFIQHKVNRCPPTIRRQGTENKSLCDLRIFLTDLKYRVEYRESQRNI